MICNLITRFDLARYDFWKWRTEGIWRWIAHRLPRKVAYFAYFRVLAHAWAQEGNKHPDELTMNQIATCWERSSGDLFS